MTWEVKKLGEITTKIGSGATPRGGQKSYKTEGISLIRSMNVHDRYFKEKNLAFIDDKQANDLSNVTLQANDILLNITGASVARCCIVPDKYLPARVNQHVSIIRPKPEIMDSSFLNLLLTSKYYKDQLLFTGEQGATRQAITKVQLQDFIIHYPPLTEQKRIVAILDEAFESIACAKESAEKNLKNANEIFESYLQSVFENKGDGWDEKTLGSLSNFVSVGHVGPTSKFYCEKHEGIPFLRSQNVRPAKLSMKGIRYILPEFHKKLKKSQLKSGDLLFVRVGANRGDCCSLPENLGEINCANIVFARPTEASPKFLELFCLSQIGRKRLLGMTTGSAQGVINTKSVAELLIPLPNIKEQLAIEKKFNLISAETKKLEAIYTQKLSDLEELKKSILQKAFNGELTEASA
jgi:type I restriction enzyme S subunit